jgi:hypothetical protein
MPLTRAVEAVYIALNCKEQGVSRRQVGEFLVNNCACGWHHVAGPGHVRKVSYYATRLTDEQKRELLAMSRKRPLRPK